MMIPGDFDMSPVHRYTGSFKGVLKQTMVNQDVIFKNQVHELHRLYRVQESLMKDFGWEECNRYNTWKQNVQSSLVPCTNITRYEPLAKEIRFPSTAKLSLTNSRSQELPTDCQGSFAKLQYRPLDLQLSANEFINHVEEECTKQGNVQNCLEGPMDFSLSCGNSSDVKLSLSIGGDESITGHTMRTSFTKKTCSSHNVIDLEESGETMLHGDARCGLSLNFAFPETNSTGKHEFQTFAFSKPFLPTGLKKDLLHGIAESNSFHEYTEFCQQQTSSSEGVKECHDEVPSDDMSSKIPQLTSYRGQLDLNKVILDDASCCSDDHMLVQTSRESSEGGSDRLHESMQDRTCPTTFLKKEIECPNEVSHMIKQDKAINLVDLNSKSMNTDIWTRSCENNSTSGSVVNLLGPESMLRSPGGILDDLGSCRGNHKNDCIELKSKLSREASCEKSEVDNALFSRSDQSPNTLQDGQGSKSPASCKSCISDNDSSSGKTTRSGITYDVSNQNRKTHLGSQVDHVLTREHDQRTSDSSDQNECYKKKKESAEVDVLINEAAELLIHISSVRSACGHDSYTAVGPKKMEIEKRQQPQCSFDSFELIALNLTESNLDEDCVSSKPFEINSTDTKDFGLKLRRGRRMKDFQKEILPNLASLSRHEILEDVNIMEGVLRSREYRKNRAKMAACGENWSAPVRSRRSRVNYLGRRNFS